MGHRVMISAQFRCNKCPIYTLDGASAKFSTNSNETDNSVYNNQSDCVSVSVGTNRGKMTSKTQ
jgi:hypothetical protein